MSSLKNQLHFEPFTAATTASRHPATAAASQPPKKKQKMSLSQTYFLAHSARGKLSSEAARPDHNLRLLVGHANLLDALMVDLHEAEREQEAWLEATVQNAQSSKPASNIKWVDREMALDIPDGSDDSEADSDDSDYEEEEEEEEFSVPIRRMRSPPPTKRVAYYDDADEEADYSTDEDDDDMFEDDDFDQSLSLVRTKSHSPDSSHHISASSSPEVPELVSDSEPESDDESSPSSPSIPELSYTAPSLSKTPQKPQVAQAYNEDFLHPNRQSPLVAAY